MENKITSGGNNGQIFWVSWHHNPYNDYLFDELSKSFNLDVFYIKKVLPTHPWSGDEGVKHKSYYLNNVKSIFFAFQKCLTQYNIRVIAGWNHPVMIVMIVILAIAGKDYAIWSDTPALSRKNNLIKKILRKWWLNFAFHNAKKIMVTGNIGVQRMRELGVKVKKTLNFPFATNINYFRPGASNDKPVGAVTFISSGRLVNSHKAFDIAVKAFGMLKRENPDLVFSYLIAGTGPDEDSINELISKENLDIEVKLLGWVQQKDLLSFYLKGDVFVHPSHFDPFPNVVLEAMAVGLPVIGSDAAGSVLERVDEGVNGFIFKDNDVNGLKNKICKIITNASKLQEMKIASRNTALNWDINFNIKQMEVLIA